MKTNKSNTHSESHAITQHQTNQIVAELELQLVRAKQIQTTIEKNIMKAKAVAHHSDDIYGPAAKLIVNTMNQVRVSKTSLNSTTRMGSRIGANLSRITSLVMRSANEK